MDDKIIYCSSKAHEKRDAILYCQKCGIYMCNKCEIFHSNLFSEHNLYKIDKNNKDIFTGICKEENHNEPLEFFCKTHNKLCCSSCLCKIRHKGKGQHKDCNVCIIEEIKEDKKKRLKQNIKKLQNFSQIIEESMKKINIEIQKINEKKENMKKEIQKLFTKFRNNLNEKEDEMLIEIDKQFDLYLKEDIIKENKNLSNEIKISIEKGITMDNDWNDNNKISLLINDCINIERIIEKICIINDSIKKCDLNNLKIIYDDENNKIIKEIPFTKLEYIESSGKQFIDTKIKGNSNYNFIIDFSLSKIIHHDTKFFGIDSDPKVCAGTISSKFRFFHTVHYYGEKFNYMDTNRHKCTIGKNVIFDNNIIFSNLSFNHPYNMYLFNSNKNGFNKNEYGSSIKLYGAKITLNNNLIRDFIPVLDFSGIPCLLEKIEKKFYYNLGEGAFTYGKIKWL